MDKIKNMLQKTLIENGINETIIFYCKINYDNYYVVETENKNEYHIKFN